MGEYVKSPHNRIFITEAKKIVFLQADVKQSVPCVHVPCCRASGRRRKAQWMPPHPG